MTKRETELLQRENQELKKLVIEHTIQLTQHAQGALFPEGLGRLMADEFEVIRHPETDVLFVRPKSTMSLRNPAVKASVEEAVQQLTDPNGGKYSDQYIPLEEFSSQSNSQGNQNGTSSGGKATPAEVKQLQDHYREAEKNRDAKKMIRLKHRLHSLGVGTPAPQ